MKENLIRSMKPAASMVLNFALLNPSVAISQEPSPVGSFAPSESAEVYYESAFNLHEYDWRLGIMAPRSIFVCEMNNEPIMIQDDIDITPNLVRVENADCEEFTPLGEVFIYEDVTGDLEFLGEPELTDLNEVRAAGIPYPPVFDSVSDSSVFYE